MAKLEDVQDVAAAKRANAEAKAELAEFDESVQPNSDNSNTLDRTDSKYFELISQVWFYLSECYFLVFSFSNLHHLHLHGLEVAITLIDAEIC